MKPSTQQSAKASTPQLISNVPSKPPSTKMPAQVIPGVSLPQRSAKHPEHENLSIVRLNDHRPQYTTHYMMASVQTVEAGKPILLSFPGSTIVYILEGEHTLVDRGKPIAGEEFYKAVAGDIVQIDKDTLVTWNTSTKGRFFSLVWAPTTYTPEDLVITA